MDRLLADAAFAELLQQWPRALVVGMLQQQLDALRDRIAAGAEAVVPDPTAIASHIAASIGRLAGGSLVPVLNATGVVLHTNLGRAPLADVAIRAIADVSGGYSNLEYDTATGARGSRYTHCRTLLCHLTGAEDALVVNNNAAALVLALNTLARGLDAVVSRGELVEIGGAFRVPEIMSRSGAQLREVGSTNRTRIEDYRAVIGPATGALLKVHPSNFTMSGYTEETSVAELADLARSAGVPLIHDIGSGLLLDPADLGLPADEPGPQGSLAAGADVITMSGDKLMGGPQCGIIIGSSALLERMRRNPLCRALRVDKLTIAALSATLALYLEPARAKSEIPALRMLTLTPESIETRALAMARKCAAAGVTANTVAGMSAVGGGAAAGAVLPTTLLLIERDGMSASELDRRLRAGKPPMATRIVDDRVAIDLRTIAPHADPDVLRAIAATASS